MLIIAKNGQELDDGFMAIEISQGTQEQPIQPGDQYLFDGSFPRDLAPTIFYLIHKKEFEDVESGRTNMRVHHLAKLSVQELVDHGMQPNEVARVSHFLNEAAGLALTDSEITPSPPHKDEPEQATTPAIAA